MLGFWTGLSVLIIILVGVAIFDIRYLEADEDDISMKSIVIIVIWLVVLLFGQLVSFCSAKDINEQEYQVSSYNLQSLVNKSETKTNSYGGGVFFLGIGGGMGGSKTETNQYYYTIVDYPNKGCKINKYDIGDTYIKEDASTSQPYVEVINKKFDRFYTKNFICGGIFKPLKPTKGDIFVCNVLHVPKGTIQIDWNVDLEK